MYATYEYSAESVKMAVVQPNVDCYAEKFADNGDWQMENLVELLHEIPRDVEVVALPETALPEHLQDNAPENGWSVKILQDATDSLYNHAMIIAGASTVKYVQKCWTTSRRWAINIPPRHPSRFRFTI